jgi:hypothetical protein
MKKKVCIVTADFGNHIKNFNPIIPKQNEDLYEVIIKIYDDNNTTSRINSLHPRTKGKIPKMLEWMETESDYYIWIDSKFKVKSENFVNDIINYLGDYEICLFEHPNRDSIKKEGDFVLSGIINNDEYLIDRYSGEKIKEQIDFYLNDKDFVDQNLFSLGFFVFSKKLIINKDYNLMTDWFFHNCYWSIQDQLSLPYLLQKHKTKYKTFNFNIFFNNYIEYRF